MIARSVGARKRVAATAALLFVLALVLTGCSQIAGAKTSLIVLHTDRGDVTCAVYQASDAGSIDCDWEHPQ